MSIDAKHPSPSQPTATTSDSKGKDKERKMIRKVEQSMNTGDEGELHHQDAEEENFGGGDEGAQDAKDGTDRESFSDGEAISGVLEKVLSLNLHTRVLILLPKEFRTSKLALIGVGETPQTRTMSIPAARTIHLGNGLTFHPCIIRVASDPLRLKKRRPTTLRTHLGRNL
ncbi:hypothetical protein CY34DRAFT_805834, partial [Suillus luteus UH-Slu-Lm8-n1]